MLDDRRDDADPPRPPAHRGGRPREAPGSEDRGDDGDDEREGSDAEDLVDPLEARVFQLAHELVTVEWADEELTAKLNIIAEALEETESSFRKDRVAPYRREGHLIGSLLQVLEQQDEFYSLLESKLGEHTDNRVKAAVCRVLLATVPVNSRFIVRLLYEEETLEQMCEYAATADPPLRCYATGLLAVGLRDRSIADIVVNKETAITFLKRVRLYASKLERERQQAVKYMQDHLRSANIARSSRRGLPSNANTAQGTSRPAIGSSRSATGTSKRKTASQSQEAVDVDSSQTSSRPTQDTDMNDDDTVEGTDAGSTQTAEDVLTRNESAGVVLDFVPDADRHEEDLKRLVMLELLYTLDCIGLMGEYLELFAPALREDIVGTIVTFLHSKNPTVLSHTMKLTSHFLAHKKFCFSLIDVGGVELIFSTASTHQLTGSAPIGLLDRSLSMCLHGLASSSAVMEKLLTMDSDSLLSVSFNLLSSPNDRARQNAVVFYGLTLTFKSVMDFFEKQNGLYTLLNIIRAGNHPKSAVQRQLSHDACLCLRQYLRVHLALVSHRLRRRLSQLNHPNPRNSATSGGSATPVLSAASPLPRFPARVPKLHGSKPMDIDDKAHEQNLVFYEMFRFSVPNSSGSGVWSAASGPGGSMWSPAAKLSHLRGILVMLEVVAKMSSFVQSGDAEDSTSNSRMWIVERAQFCLEALRVITLVVPTLAAEICACDVAVEEAGSSKHCTGLTILLDITTSTNARDSDLVRDALRVFCNCVSPPHSEDCWQHPHKDIRQYTLTARNMRKLNTDTRGKAAEGDEDSTLHCCSRVRDDKPLRPVRKLAREKNAIKVCIQLLRYKRSVQNADAIRLLATRALLGLARDRQIAQILEKMQVGQLLSDLIRLDPVLEENADLHVRFRESALDLISLVTHKAPNAVINEAADPTVRKIEKASIVAQTTITYDAKELLALIHDHLVAGGLAKTAAVLRQEADIDRERVPKTPERRDKVPRLRGPNEAEDDNNRPSKIPRLVLNQTTAADSHADGHAREKDEMFDLWKQAPRKAIMLPPGQRRRRVRQAFCTPHLFNMVEGSPPLNRSASDPSTPKRSCRVSSTFLSASTDNRVVGPPSSRLDEIITHYLREQHRQCANPVTTVPPFRLIGSNAIHSCPDPSTIARVPINIWSRLSERSRTGFRSGSKALSSPYADAGVNRYVYSRYRPFRTLGAHDSMHWGASVARFHGREQRDVLMGNHDGLVRQVNIDTDAVVEEWTCHSSSSAVSDIETNIQTRLGLIGSSLIVTGGVAITSFGLTEIALWDVQSMGNARWRFSGALSPRFNHYGDRIVGLDARVGDGDHDLHGEREVVGAVIIDVATGTALCDLRDDVHTNDYKRNTNCSFSADDGTILTGGVMWDSRIPSRPIYKFDKLSNVGFGFFHPNGNEVIINSAVWDLRTYRLLRMVPALDKCTLDFNYTGNVMFAYAPHSMVDEADRRRPRAKTWFRVLDARDYREISTIELQRPIYDLKVNASSTLLSVIEGRYHEAESSTEDDPVCRLYEIGRKRPSEDDSDVEDGHEASDTMDDDEFDDESNSEDDEDEEDDDLDEDDYDDMDDDDEMDDDDADEFMYDVGEGLSDRDGMYSDDPDATEVSEADDGDGIRHRPRSRGSSLSARDIQFLFELPDGAYYEVHDEYSTEEEEEDAEE